MRKSHKNIHIGTSGWSYPHWKENFYPKEVKQNQWLNHYSQAFSTVEVNTTFYRTPPPKTFQNWFGQVPDNFSFSLKANRYITHQKRLHDCHEYLDFFYKNLEDFKSKTGPILFQLPPSFQVNKERLQEFVEELNEEYRYVFEFRHLSWFTNEIYKLLAANNIGLCITDLNGEMSPEEITSDFTYIRLHGPKKGYQGSYNPSQLETWKTKIEHWAYKVSVYCYFDNDEKGYAVEDAKSLKVLLS